MSKNAAPDTPIKAVIIIGPDPNFHHLPTPFLTAFKSRNYQADSDFFIIGNGKDKIKEQDLRTTLEGRIDASTRFFIMGHGLVEKINNVFQHTIEVLEPDTTLHVPQAVQRTTTHLLKLLQNIAGKQPLYVDTTSCYAGQNKYSVQHLEEGSFLVTHASRRHTSYIHSNRQAIIAGVTRHINESSKPGFDPEMAMLTSFTHTISATIETVNISQNRENHVLCHTFRSPRQILRNTEAFKQYMLAYNLSNYLTFLEENFPESQETVRHTITQIPFKRYYQQADFASRSNYRVQFGASHDIPAYTRPYFTASAFKKFLIYPFRKGRILYEAADSGSAKVLEQYFTLNPSRNDINVPFKSIFPQTQSNDGKTLLHFAAPHPKAVKVLLKHGASPNIKDKAGNTPLVYAAGHYRSIAALLENGADPNLPDSDGDMPLHNESSAGNHLCVKKLLRHGADPDAVGSDNLTPLQLAVSKGHSKTVRTLLAHCKNIECQDKHGQTPLLYAAQHGFDEIVTMLLEKKADQNATDKYGVTPLHWSILNHHPETTQALLTYHADTDKGNNVGRTSVHCAVFAQDVDTLHVLLEAGANPDVQDAYKETPLHMAIKKDLVRATTTLLEHGANPNLRDSNGMAPLHWSIFYNYPETIQMLLEHKADPNLPHTEGQTALHLAVYGKSLDKVKILMAYGGNPMIKDDRGISAYDHAKSEGHTEIVTFIEEEMKKRKEEKKKETEPLAPVKQKKSYTDRVKDDSPKDPSFTEREKEKSQKKTHRRKTHKTSFTEKEDERKKHAKNDQLLHD